MPIYCRNCHQTFPDLLATDTSTQCPNCQSPISFKDALPRSTARLLLKDGDETRGEFPVNKVVSIGKDKSNGVQILHPTVGLKHAEVRPVGAGFVIRDLGSQSGTFVNGKKVSESPLADGDELRLGDMRFLFLNPPENLLPGQDFAISYTAGQQDLDAVAARVPTDQPAVAVENTPDSAAISAEVKRLTKVYEIGRELASSTDLAIVLERIMDALFENIHPSRAAILLKHPVSGELYTTVARTQKGGRERAHISLSRTIVNEVINRREAVLIDDTAKLKVTSEHTIRRHGIRAAVCVPLMYKDQPLGTIYADSIDIARTFNESDLRLLTGVAGMAAVAIVNARLITRLGHEQRLRKELEQRVGVEGWTAGLAALTARRVAVLALRLADIGTLLDGGRPERIATLLQELLGIVSDRVQKHDGVVIGVHGASILAVWGVHQPRESDAQSALQSAFELRTLFEQLNSGRLKRGLRPIWLSYAIAAGQGLVGPLTFRGRNEPCVVGSSVDTALLLASRAPRNHLWISQATQGLLGENTKCTAIPPIQLCEGDEPVNGFEVE